MNAPDPLLDEIIVLMEKVHALYMQHYLDREIFSFTWWVGIAMIVLPLLYWWKVVDRKRLLEMMLYGCFVNSISTFLDVGLSNFMMWEYPVQIFPHLALFMPVDYVLVPVIGMILYQKFPKWGPYILFSAIASAAMSFLGEPFAVWLGMYKLIRWQYIYSFPIYTLVYIIIKFLVERIVNIKTSQP